MGGQILLMGTQSENQFRAEFRDANNEVKGVYSWLDASGKDHTVAFNSGKNGHQIMPLEKSGIELPPFPYGLYGDRPKEIQARTLTKSVECIDPGSVLCDNMVVIGLEEDIVPKLESIEDDIITTTEYPTDTTEIEDTEDIQTTEPTPTESPNSLESEPEEIKKYSSHSLASNDTKQKLPQIRQAEEKNIISRMPRFLIFPLNA